MQDSLFVFYGEVLGIEVEQFYPNISVLQIQLDQNPLYIGQCR